MKIRLLLLSLTGAFFLITSCVSTSPVAGLLFTNTSSHLDYSFSRGTTLTNAKIEKKGVDCHWNVVIISSFFSDTSLSVKEAMEDGEITKIATVDYESVNVLGPVFYENCVVVYGE
jgi:hypothetical protein